MKKAVGSFKVSLDLMFSDWSSLSINNNLTSGYIFIDIMRADQVSNNESIMSLNTAESFLDNVQETSLILKVSLDKVGLLVAGDIDHLNPETNTPVIQMMFSALIMYQSVENLDCSGFVECVS